MHQLTSNFVSRNEICNIQDFESKLEKSQKLFITSKLMLKHLIWRFHFITYLKKNHHQDQGTMYCERRQQQNKLVFLEMVVDNYKTYCDSSVVLSLFTRKVQTYKSVKYY